MKVITVDGANGGLDTNYEGKAKAALDVLTRDGYDFVYVHLEGPDEMRHQGSVEKKVKEIERLIRQGHAFDDIAAHARGFLQKTRILFALSSFDNLIKNGRIHRLTGMLAKALGIWGIGSGSDEGKIAFESKARGAKKAVQTLVSTMKEHGFIGGNVAISHCDNFALAQTLKNSILDIWENTSIEILPTRGLCSYYAERGGLIVSY